MDTGYVYIEQECSGVITRNTPSHILGLVTDGIGPCSGVAASYGPEDLFLCHADDTTDLMDRSHGLFSWAHSLFEVTHSFLVRPIIIRYNNDGIPEDFYKRVIDEISAILQEEYLRNLKKKLGKSTLFKIAGQSWPGEVHSDEDLKKKLVHAAPARDGMKAVAVYRGLSGSRNSNIEFYVSLPREIDVIHRPLESYRGSIVGIHEGTNPSHLPPICVFDGNQALDRDEVVQVYQNDSCFNSLIEVLRLEPRTPSTPSTPANSEDGQESSPQDTKTACKAGPSTMRVP